MEPSASNLAIVIVKIKPVKGIVVRSPLLRSFLNPENFIRKRLLKNPSIRNLVENSSEIKEKASKSDKSSMRNLVKNSLEIKEKPLSLIDLPKPRRLISKMSLATNVARKDIFPNTAKSPKRFKNLILKMRL